ncbi:MAG TPA: hypothetical protein VGQ42_12990 [Candidatus Dormibacteraeota bacterium]|nr:hypothetical protein [Candidatus Dormibacteraeota bacterium]
MRARRTLLATLLATAAAATTATVAQAATPPSLKVEAGYGKVPIAPGLWVPVTARITGGDGGVDGTLRITPPVEGTLSPVAVDVPVDVTAGQSRSVTVAVRAAAGTVTAELRAADGTRLAGATGTLLAGNQGNILVATVAAAAGSLDAIAGTYVLGGHTQNVDAVPLAPDRLPDTPALLAAFAVVVIDGIPTGGLTSAQRNALAGYVDGGGGLLLSGGGAAPQVLEGIPAGLLAATAGSLAQAPLPAAITALCGTPSAQPLTAPVQQASLALLGDATALVRDTAGAPVAAVRQVGLGRSVVARFDPAAAPLAGWAGHDCLLRELLAAALPGRTAEMSMEPITPRGARTGSLNALPDSTTVPAGLADAARALVSVVPPSLTTLAVALGAYAIVAGPLAALLPRRRRRRAVLWIVLPSLAVAVGGGAWATGLGVAHVAPALTQVRVLDLGGASTASVRAVATLSLPRGGGATLPLAAAATVAGLDSGAGRAAQAGDRVDIVDAPPGALRTVLTGWTAVRRAATGIAQDLHWSDDTHLDGTITNHLGVALLDATLLGSDGSTSSLGRVAAGGTAKAGAVAQTMLGGSGNDTTSCATQACQAQDGRGRLLSALDEWAQSAHPGVPVLFGVAERPLLPAADGVRTVDAVVVPLTLPPATGAPLVMRGLATQGFDGGGVTLGSPTLRDGDFTVLDVPVPASGGALQLTPLSGSCWTVGCVSFRIAPSTNPLPPALLYDWLDPVAGDWRPLPETADATGHRTGRLAVARLGGGDLILRIRTQNTAASAAAPDLRVTGP